MLRLRRNAGHQAAITAGLDHSLGDHVITMDIDLQDPPEVITELLAKQRETGADVVYAQRADRGSDSHFKRRTAGIYYRLMRDVAGAKVPAHVGDFRLLSREAVDTLRALPERHRVYRLLIPWMGFPSAIGPVQARRQGRGREQVPAAEDDAAGCRQHHLLHGEASADRDLVRASGAASCAWERCWSPCSPNSRATPSPVGHPSSSPCFFLGAIQLLCLGLLGEYVGRLYAEAQHRPLYYVASDTEPAPTIRHRRHEGARSRTARAVSQAKPTTTPIASRQLMLSGCGQAVTSSAAAAVAAE